MQPSLEKSQAPSSQKVKNILIRSSNKPRSSENVHHPERSYILKYSPKYYRSLTIEITPFSPLLSKIKKIKKLKKFNGATVTSFKDSLPQELWFNLFANNRKEMEEAPVLLLSDACIEWNRSFCREFNLQKIKFFPNVTRIVLSKWRMHSIENYFDPFISIKERFIRYIGNLRRLKSLEILVKEDNYEETEWVIWKLDEMSRLLKSLETFTIKIENYDLDIQGIFHNKNVFSHVTHLSLPQRFESVFAKIPQMCKNLKSLSLGFRTGIDIWTKPEFLKFLASIKHLDQLKSLLFIWPREAINFWDHFKPQSSLRQLTLSFHASDLINERLFGKNIGPKDAVGHWEDIQELDALAFSVTCQKAEEVIFVRQFITMVLKKVRKLRSLKYYLMCPSANDEPFSVEEVPHLYESLDKFEYSLSDLSPSSKVDLKMMKPFKNLKELKLQGEHAIYENVEEVVALLEENQKEGETSVLEIKSRTMVDQDWLGDTLKKIEKVKREDKNLEMLFDLRFRDDDLFGLLERLCQDIQAAKTIKGLEISLTLSNEDDYPLPAEKLKEVLKRYNESRNVRIYLYNINASFTYVKIDGEKEQLYMN